MEEWIKKLVCEPLVSFYIVNINKCLMNKESEFAGAENARIWIKQIESLMDFIDGGSNYAT